MLKAAHLRIAHRLDDVSVSLEPGRITAICGPNGAGKSTLLEVLAGLITPDAGSVTLDGTSVGQLALREKGRRIGYLPQAAEVAWDVPVHSLVALGRMPHGDTSAEPVNAAMAALKDLNIGFPFGGFMHEKTRLPGGGRGTLSCAGARGIRSDQAFPVRIIASRRSARAPT